MPSNSSDSNVEVILPHVRLSFPHLYKAQPGRDGGEPAFGASFLMDKDRDRRLIEKCEDAIAECKEKMWGKNQPTIKRDRVPLQDGSDYDYDGYDGQMVVKGRNKKRPQLVTKRKDDDGNFIPIRDDDGTLYAGCYVNAVIRFWAQDSKDYGKRINCSLEAVQFDGEGEAFGAGSVDVNDRFKDFAEEGGGDDRDFRRGDGRRERRDEGRSGGRGREESREEGRSSDRRPRDDDRSRDDRDRGRDSGSRDRDERPRRRDDEREDRPRESERDRGGRDREERGRDRDESVRGRDEREERGRGRDDDRGGRDRDRDDDRGRGRDDDRGGRRHDENDGRRRRED